MVQKMQTAQEYQRCRDAFYESMVAFTDSDTITQAKIETAWQLKCIEAQLLRIANYLEPGSDD